MTQPTDKNLSRRDALKLLGAAAGASVLANLPSKWSTPRLTAGVLPAHAQSSCYFFEAEKATSISSTNVVLKYVEPSFVGPEATFPTEPGLGGVFFAPINWKLRWECKQGCLQISFDGEWEFVFPDGSTGGVTDNMVYVDLTAGLHGINETPQGSECEWLV